jgi:hypothetical protein
VGKRFNNISENIDNNYLPTEITKLTLINFKFEQRPCPAGLALWLGGTASSALTGFDLLEEKT